MLKSPDLFMKLNFGSGFCSGSSKIVTPNPLRLRVKMLKPKFCPAPVVDHLYGTLNQSWDFTESDFIHSWLCSKSDGRYSESKFFDSHCIPTLKNRILLWNLLLFWKNYLNSISCLTPVEKMQKNLKTSEDAKKLKNRVTFMFMGTLVRLWNQIHFF